MQTLKQANDMFDKRPVKNVVKTVETLSYTLRVESALLNFGTQQLHQLLGTANVSSNYTEGLKDALNNLHPKFKDPLHFSSLLCNSTLDSTSTVDSTSTDTQFWCQELVDTLKRMIHTATTTTITTAATHISSATTVPVFATQAQIAVATTTIPVVVTNQRSAIDDLSSQVSITRTVPVFATQAQTAVATTTIPVVETNQRSAIDDLSSQVSITRTVPVFATQAQTAVATTTIPVVETNQRSAIDDLSSQVSITSTQPPSNLMLNMTDSVMTNSLLTQSAQNIIAPNQHDVQEQSSDTDQDASHNKRKFNHSTSPPLTTRPNQRRKKQQPKVGVDITPTRLSHRKKRKTTLRNDEADDTDDALDADTDVYVALQPPEQQDRETWYSPHLVLQAVKLTFKTYGVSKPYIKLDPCTSADRNWTGADRIFTSEDDALQQEWRREDDTARIITAYVNPPFRNAEDWVKKTTQQIDNGNVKCAIMLLPITPWSNWWRTLVAKYPWAVLNTKEYFFRPPLNADDDDCGDLISNHCPVATCLIALAPMDDTKFFRCFYTSMTSPVKPSNSNPIATVYKPVQACTSFDYTT